MKSERFSTKEEIYKYYKDRKDNYNHAGIDVYFDPVKNATIKDCESHAMIIGRTGCGKTECITKNFQKNIAAAHESGIACLSKNDDYHQIKGFFNDYEQFYCLDFSDPLASPNGYNIFLLLVNLLKSEDPSEQELGQQLTFSFFESVIPICDKKDPFWDTAGRQLCRSIFLGMVEVLGSDEKNNLKTFAKLLNSAEQSGFGATTLLRIFADIMPSNCEAYDKLQGYLQGPNDTRKSIFTTTQTAIDRLTSSKSIVDLLSSKDCFLQAIDFNRPFFIYVILPEMSSIHNIVAGAILNQIISYSIYKSKHFEKESLPIRLNVLIEELGSTIGYSLQDLPKYMSVSRSHNIRIVGVLQSESQLEKIYEKSSAEEILDNVGLTMIFNNNSFEMSQKYAQRIGKHYIDSPYETGIWEDLVSPQTIMSMPTGLCLVFKENLKFFTKLPFFYEQHKRIENSDFMNKIIERPTSDYISDIRPWLLNKRREKFFDPSPKIAKKKDDLDKVLKTLFEDVEIEKVPEDLDDM